MLIFKKVFQNMEKPTTVVFKNKVYRVQPSSLGQFTRFMVLPLCLNFYCL